MNDFVDGMCARAEVKWYVPGRFSQLRRVEKFHARQHSGSTHVNPQLDNEDEVMPCDSPGLTFYPGMQTD